MSFSCAAVHAQPLIVVGGTDPGGECADYAFPAPTAVITDLDMTVTSQPPTSVETNLCSEIV